MKLLTKAAVIRNNEDFKTLINAVIRNLHGLESIADVNNYGINGGYGKFIYYSDTHSFAMKYRKDIVALLEREADELSEEIVEMVGNFGYFRNNKMDNEDKRELYKYIGGGKCEQSTVTNLMAWYAAETVCIWFEQ